MRYTTTAQLLKEPKAVEKQMAASLPTAWIETELEYNRQLSNLFFDDGFI